MWQPRTRSRRSADAILTLVDYAYLFPGLHIWAVQDVSVANAQGQLAYNQTPAANRYAVRGA
jgi:hypothetical protein